MTACIVASSFGALVALAVLFLALYHYVESRNVAVYVLTAALIVSLFVWQVERCRKKDYDSVGVLASVGFGVAVVPVLVVVATVLAVIFSLYRWVQGGVDGMNA